MDMQTESELRALQHFVELARLPVVPESIVKRDPPEPMCGAVSREGVCRYRQCKVQMNRRFLVRNESHQIEEQSERFFRDSLARNWTCEKPAHDYGIDLRIDMFEGNNATGLELLVQLKSSSAGTKGDTEIVRLRTATYNLLSDKLQVAMLVKFVESEKEAYWLLFRDIPAPSKADGTFCVHIPKANRLSGLDWSKMQDYVRSVTNQKLAAIRKQKIELGHSDV